MSANSVFLQAGSTGEVGTDFDNAVVMVLPDTPDDDENGDEAPETPLDEPRPPRVQDPPPQPDTKGPYVVRAQGSK